MMKRKTTKERNKKGRKRKHKEKKQRRNVPPTSSKLLLSGNQSLGGFLPPPPLAIGVQTDLQEFFLITSSILDIWPSCNHRLSHPASAASVHILSLFFCKTLLNSVGYTS